MDVKGIVDLVNDCLLIFVAGGGGGGDHMHMVGLTSAIGIKKTRI